MKEKLPGTIEALDAGCKCPRYDNRFGKAPKYGWTFVIHPDCPVHDAEDMYV